MNKLIIAGNGFDLAHGLPTSYNHFMDAFWQDLKKNQDDEIVKKIVHLDPIFQDYFNEGEVTNFKTFEANIHNYLKNNLRSHEYQLETYTFSQRGRSKDYGKQVVLFKFKNEFFKKLNEVKSIQNWVDVENEYYKRLKFIIKKQIFPSGSNRRHEIEVLNKEFEQVKQLLERYLQKNVVEAYDFQTINQEDSFKIFDNLEPFKNKSELLDRLKLFEEFSNIEDQDEIVNSKSKVSKKKILDSGVLILNFNYTPTLMVYSYQILKDKKEIVIINHIHGELNKNIVFGFGDEMDDDYKLIENIDDNEYLKYFKSFQYVQNSNYKNVLRYIDSEKFQVIIMGHSCGLSDRTLLNTIFEHKNCEYIKVFYHQKDDGTDNYTEVVQNISRHFNDKKLMRTKIVEKTLCEPMPQIQLPKKE